MNVVRVRWTAQFANWLGHLRDERAKGLIGSRIGRLREGHFGPTRSLGHGLSELKIDYGPGYRLYVTLQGTDLVILLCGGDKSSQERDIKAARTLLEQLRS